MKLRINYLRVRLIDENKMTDAEKAGILEYFTVLRRRSPNTGRYDLVAGSDADRGYLRYKDLTLVTVCYDYIYYYKTSDKGLKWLAAYKKCPTSARLLDRKKVRWV
jgi:hypothetical protein